MSDNRERDERQDEMIRQNAERISRNEEAIRRQTEALESIRDHYYPPPAKWWKRAIGFMLKVICVVLAYAGGVQAVDWYLNVRKSESMAAQCAAVAERLFFEEGNSADAARFLERAAELDEGNSKYRLAGEFMRNVAAMARLFDIRRPLTAEERASVDAALTEARFMIESVPGNPMSYVLAAQALAFRGEREESLAHIDRAVQMAPENVQVRTSACAMHFFNGDVAGARAQLAEAERLDDGYPLVLIWKGLLAMLVDRDSAAAQRAFEGVTRRSPRLAAGHALLGHALLGGGRREEARAAFRRALVLDARQESALYGLAMSYAEEGKLPLARLWYDRLLAADGNSMDALLGLAEIKLAEGDAEGAVEDLTRAIGLAPLDAELYRKRAEALERAGQDARAKTDRDTAAALK